MFTTRTLKLNKPARIFVPLAILFTMSCNNKSNPAASNSLSNKEKNDGWELLFDGSTTNGWHRYGAGAIDSVWKVEDGSLFLDTDMKKANGAKGDWDIVSEKEYSDFHLKLDWKISPKGNSGIILYIHENKAKYNWPWQTGMEMQVLDNDGHADGKFKTHRAGDLYDLISVSKETVKPVGEWNHVEIKAVKGKLDFWLNGEHVISTNLWDDNWKKMVAGSKFKSMPDFGTYKSGRIGLQDHGDKVWYRNVIIKAL